MTDIAELIERVRQATGPDRELDRMIAGEPEGATRWGFLPQYTASLDAITALVEWKLPGWVYNIAGCQPEFLTDKDRPFGADLMGPVSWRVLDREVGEEPVFNHHSASKETAPLALCLAFLLVLQSQEIPND